MKRQPTEWEKIFANYIVIRSWQPQIYKELIQCNTKIKPQMIRLKNGQRNWTDIFQMYMWPTCTWKGTQHHNHRGNVNQNANQNQNHNELSLIRVRMAVIKKTRDKCWWECKSVQPLWTPKWRFLPKLKTDLPYDPEIPFLSILSKEIRRGPQRNICTPMFVAVLVTIA